MKISSICIFFCCLLNISFSQNYFISTVSVDRYLTEEVPTTFETTITSNDQKEFRKLRNFLKDKNELLYALNEKTIEYPDYTERIKTYSEDIESLRSLISNTPKGQLIVLPRPLSKYVFDYYYNMGGDEDLFYQPKKLQKEEAENLLTDMKSQKQYLEKSDSTRKILRKNIENVKSDISKCNSIIDSTLAPEYKEQQFRIIISICFTVLIAILLIIFFYIVYSKSDGTLSKDLLSGNGLQFVTLFVLIIAIILFGILSILKGSELAAILSGISGYILGKGVGPNSTLNNSQATVNAPPNNLNPTDTKPDNTI